MCVQLYYTACLNYSGSGVYDFASGLGIAFASDVGVWSDTGFGTESSVGADSGFDSYSGFCADSGFGTGSCCYTYSGTGSGSEYKINWRN